MIQGEEKRHKKEDTYQYLTTSSSNCHAVFSATFLKTYVRTRCNRMAPTVTPKIMNAADTVS
jgi:hypothetical protein